MTTATTGGFTGDPAEAFDPPGAGTCCGSAPESDATVGAAVGTAAVSSCCGNAAAEDTGGSCCGGPAVAEGEMSGAGCCG